MNRTTKLDVKKFSQGCGVTVNNARLDRLLSTQLEELRELLAEHGVLFFRNQELTPEDHLAFAQSWGEIVVNKFFKPVKSYPQIAEVRKNKDQEMNIGGGWHTDHSYDEIPALGSILVARVLPSAGGGTRFANLEKAYDALPSRLKTKIQSLSAKHSNKHIYGEGGYYRYH